MLSPEKQLLAPYINETPQKSDMELSEYIYDKISFKKEEDATEYKQFVVKNKARLLKRNKSVERLFSKSPKSWMANFKGSMRK